ncbi:alpha-L-rhamnosidase [Bombilactobacillus bombi]|uniref:alpha-L-rhamnosidase n=1 Tax=Bombilactobacillus bombi TaxID=1303590 RepID=UPI0035EAB7E0
MKNIKNTADMWQGCWISSDQATVSDEPDFDLADMFAGKKQKFVPVEKRLHPVVYFKKTFIANKYIKKASLQITAQGIYQAYMNGRKVTSAIFTPDYTNYNKFLQYQTYDITDKLIEGLNVFCVQVADGWYAGRISVQGGSTQFGNQLALLADIIIEYQNGKKEIIGTNHSFTSGEGKHCYADIEIGEKQDLRISDNWLKDSKKLVEPVIEIKADYSRLVPQTGPLVHCQQPLASKKIWQEDSSLIIDFGQVIAGRVRLTANFAYNQKIVLKHSEVLDENGKFYQNIVGRNKDQTDIFIGNGQQMTVEPDFTFHGFRYVKISGLTEQDFIDAQAIPIYSNMPETGWIKTDNGKINQLLSNIKWSQRGNMLSIPTDCPQRERVGWTGDMQVFAPASTFFMNTEAFIRRWLKNVRLDQRANGEIIDYSPAPKDAAKSVQFTGSYSSAGWGDAIIMVPWTLYQRYGHIDVLQENYQAMTKWIEFAQQSAASDKVTAQKYLWDTKFHYGDWMFPSLMLGPNPDPMKTSKLTKDVVATAFLKHSNDLMFKISEILGLDGKQYQDYAQKVQTAFTKYYVTNDKHLINDYQGCYVLAIAFDLVPPKLKANLLDRLVQKIHDNNDLLDTGFLATPYLLDVLTDNGYIALAQKLFLQESCPSWLYEVNHGATTIWESWAGIQPDGHVGEFSFNHYAMGCVLDWFVRDVVGIHSEQPGYQIIKIWPRVKICNKISASYVTDKGLVKVDLNYHDDYQELTVNIPLNTRAVICLPYHNDTQKYQLLRTYTQGTLNQDQKYLQIQVEAGSYYYRY